MDKEKLDAKYLFDVESGTITSKKTGKALLCKNKAGYAMVKIDGKFFYAHRILFFIANGYMPALVDHINENKSDNRRVNLRELTHKQNLLNRSSVKGVYFNKKNNKWVAQISSKYLGSFDTEDAASSARKMAVNNAMNATAN